MWIKAPGELSENISQLSTAVSTHLLLTGDEIALIDASITLLAPGLVETIQKEAGILNYLFITHAHFDHVGGLPVLRKTFPDLKVVTGRKTAKLFEDKKVLKELYDLNSEAYLAANMKIAFDFDTWCESFKIDHLLSDGDVVDLGSGIEVKLIETPGHSSDSVCYLIKPDLALVAGEALGSYFGRDLITPSFCFDYDMYLSSVEKINKLEIKIVSFPHSGILTGELIPRFLSELPNECRNLKQSITERIRSGELVDEISNSIASEWEGSSRLVEGPFTKLHQQSVRDMVRAISKVMN